MSSRTKRTIPMKITVLTIAVFALSTTTNAAELTSLTKCNNLSEMPLIRSIDGFEGKLNPMTKTIFQNGKKLGSTSEGPQRQAACASYKAQLEEYKSLLIELNKYINKARPAVKEIGEMDCYEEITNDNKIISDNWNKLQEKSFQYCSGGGISTPPDNSGGGGR